jgi:hypothetical protein
MALTRNQLDELRIAEGLRWRTHETCYGERVDPEGAKKGAQCSTLHARGLPGGS